MRDAARTLIEARLLLWKEKIPYVWNRVFIRQQKTRWGSCSSKGNLNFNVRLLSLPLALVDYVIVHELCHLKEMNHGPQFWSLVETYLPDYRERKEELRTFSLRTQARMKKDFPTEHNSVQ